MDVLYGEKPKTIVTKTKGVKKVAAKKSAEKSKGIVKKRTKKSAKKVAAQ